MNAAATTLRYIAPAEGVSHYEGRSIERIPTPRVPSRSISAATDQYADKGFDHHFAKLQSLPKDRSLWPTGSAAPATHTQARAWLMLRDLESQEFPPTRVVASAEGGVAICFIRGDKYADVEFLNTGEILGVVSNRRDRPVVWELEQTSRNFTRAIARIRELLDSPAPKADATRWPWARPRI